MNQLLDGSLCVLPARTSMSIWLPPSPVSSNLPLYTRAAFLLLARGVVRVQSEVTASLMSLPLTKLARATVAVSVVLKVGWARRLSAVTSTVGVSDTLRLPIAFDSTSAAGTQRGEGQGAKKGQGIRFYDRVL